MKNRNVKKPGGLNGPNRRARCKKLGTDGLDDAQHDRADKGECSIGGKDAQSADDSHGSSPWLTPLPCNQQPSRSFPEKKVSLAVYCHFPTAGTVVKTS
jgi:hypothetical protein